MADKDFMSVIGVEGVQIFGGIPKTDYVDKLNGSRGRKVYTQMATSNATIGAILFAVEMLLRSVKWTVENDTDDDFLHGVLFEDMNITWEDFISNVTTMLTYGWSAHEIVFKRRGGDTDDSTQRSNFSDGRIGIRKIAHRAQATLDRWDMDADGSVKGLWQRNPNNGLVVLIPMDKLLLFKTKPASGNPEGVSILRNAYDSWFILKNV